MKKPCSECGGSGKYYTLGGDYVGKCDSCDGTAWVVEQPVKCKFCICRVLPSHLYDHIEEFHYQEYFRVLEENQLLDEIAAERLKILREDDENQCL